MTFIIESIVACALFTLFVFLMSRDPIKTVFNYPPAIIERCDKLGLVDASNKPGGAAFYTKKIVALVVFGILLGLLVRYVNGCTTYLSGALTAYALWCVVNWFDAIVLDCIWFCHDRHFIIPGTEDMTADYHDYWFHIRGALIGMLLALPAVAIAGLLTLGGSRVSGSEKEADRISAQMAVDGVSNYCHSEFDWSPAQDNPSLMYVSLADSTETEYNVVFRSYTGALTYFHVDRESGTTRLVEFVPALNLESEAGSINLRDYLK